MNPGLRSDPDRSIDRRMSGSLPRRGAALLFPPTFLWARFAPMRILHLGKYYAPAKGGMETALRHLTEGLLAAGHEVRVLVAGHQRDTVRDDLPGAPGALVRAGVAWTWNSQPVILDLAGHLRREIDDFRPHLVHLHTPNPLAGAAWLRSRGAARRHGTQLAVWHHSDIVRQRLSGRLAQPLVRHCLADAAGICVSNAALRDQSRELAPWRDRVQVIPFGIDPVPFAAEPTGDGPFLFVGRLVPYKGVDVLLEAMAGLSEARLDIVGSGPQCGYLEARIGGLGLGDRVRLLGNVPDPDLPAILARCSALVLPSLDRSETFGLILLEAMAAGVALVASDLPTGVRELCRPGETGWLAPPGDVAALRAALAAVLADRGEARRRGAAGRERVRQQYTREHQTESLAAWYVQLVAAGPAGTGAPGRG